MTTILNSLPRSDRNTHLDLSWVRSQFPSLSRVINRHPVAFLDGPGGTQVTQSVIEAISHYLKVSNANTHGQYATSRETDEIVDGARSAMADFVGCDSDEIVFGPNMTTLTFAISRSIGRELVLEAYPSDWRLAPQAQRENPTVNGTSITRDS